MLSLSKVLCKAVVTIFVIESYILVYSQPLSIKANNTTPLVNKTNDSHSDGASLGELLDGYNHVGSEPIDVDTMNLPEGESRVGDFGASLVNGLGSGLGGGLVSLLFNLLGLNQNQGQNIQIPDNSFDDTISINIPGDYNRIKFTEVMDEQPLSNHVPLNYHNIPYYYPQNNYITPNNLPNNYYNYNPYLNNMRHEYVNINPNLNNDFGGLRNPIPKLVSVEPQNYTININLTNSYPDSFNNNTKSFDHNGFDYNQTAQPSHKKSDLGEPFDPPG